MEHRDNKRQKKKKKEEIKKQREIVGKKEGGMNAKRWWVGESVSDGYGTLIAPRFSVQELAQPPVECGCCVPGH